MGGAVVAQNAQLDPRFFIAIGGLIVAAVIGGILLAVLKSRLLGDSERAAETGGLMDELRRARDVGEITSEEYEAARKVMAARAAGMTEEEVSRIRDKALGAKVAEPGLDLTGQPLPGLRAGGSDEDEGRADGEGR